MGKSIQNDGAPARRLTPRLIFWMSFQLAISSAECSISFRRSRWWPVFHGPRPPRLNNTQSFPATARLRFELMDEPVRPARGKAGNKRGHFWPVQHWLPERGFHHGPERLRSSKRGRRYDCSLISLSSSASPPPAGTGDQGTSEKKRRRRVSS
jgi:hypothetical protein